MRQIVIDASVLVAALMKDGTVRNLLLHPPEVLFLAPTYLVHEVERALPKIAKRTGKSHKIVRTLMDLLLRRLVLVPSQTLVEVYDEALQRAEQADAPEDAPYIAVALATDAPVWTLDKDFRRVEGIRGLSTRQISELR